ncbi:MAG TPA: tRNA (adenosine(37)-N6)-dimethylallyltransferase MiaA [Bacteroidota bacterium]|nr:tRNA (adenosine(37)-N6)-dimethylallyltransferase MiaA [Bacteroidota bacterium]
MTPPAAPGAGNHPPGRVLALVGPTASGKTALALSVARLLPCEIVSADSRQVYRDMAVGTAQPSAAELRETTHHFVGELPPDREFNAGSFGTIGRRTIGGIFGRGRLPLVVGGSGLYLRSLLRGLFEGPEAERAVREALEARLKTAGAENLLEDLRKVDPAAAEKLGPVNARRIIRALEVYELSGRTITELHRAGIEIPFDSLQIGLRWPRPALYERINARVIGMVNEGLVEETRQLLERGYPPALHSLQTVGYREAIAHLGGRITRQEMIATIQMNTRRFAKRQMTWFRADSTIHWIDIDAGTDLTRIAADVVRLFGRGAEGK